MHYPIQWRTFILLSIPFLLFSHSLKGQEFIRTLDKEEAISCYNAANALFYKDPALASAYFEDVIPAFKAEKMWMYYCYAFVGFCSSEDRLGNESKAEQIAEQTVEEVKKYMGTANEQYILALTNLSQFYMRKGKHDKTIKALKESIAVNEAFTRVDYKLISLSYHQLAGAYKELGDVNEAIKYYEKSLQVWRAQNQPAYPHIMELFLSLANAYREVGLWEKAKRTCLTYLPNSDSLTYIRLNYGLGAVYVGLEAYDSARQYISRGQAREIQHKKPFFHYGEQLLGDISLQEGDTLLAIEHYQSAQINRLSGPRKEYSLKTLVKAYGVLGELIGKQKKYTESLEQLQLGISYLQNKEVDSTDWKYTPSPSDIIIPWESIHILTAKAQTLYALFLETKDPVYLQVAHESIQLGADIIPGIQQLHASEGGKRRLSITARPLIEIGIQINHELYLIEKEEEYLWEGFRLAEQIKSRLLIEELMETEAIFHAKLPVEKQEKIREIEAEIGYYTNAIQGIGIQSQKDSSNLEDWKNKKFTLESDLASLKSEIESEYPLYRKKKIDFPVLNKQTLAANMPQQTGLIEYFWGNEELFAFTLNSGNIQLYQVSLAGGVRNHIEETAEFLRNPNMSVSSQRRYYQSARELYKQLIEPILDTNTFTKLYVVLDGPLSYIPFETFLTEPVAELEQSNSTLTPAQTYRRLPYLFKSLNVHYLHAASLLLLGSNQISGIQQNLVAFAPNYQGLLQLKHNKTSAQTISKILGGRTYLNQDASESRFKSELNNYQAIHLAVHGNADVDAPINAYLDFGTNPETEEDGRLFVYELYALSMKSKIVSLIACEAGYGKLEKGEGVMSLARAFRIAGANSIMTSLWKADGRAASPITEKFYQDLKAGISPSESLRQAKIEFLASASPDMMHPYFWATYVLTGNDEVVWEPFIQKYGLFIAGLGLLFLGFWFFRTKNKKIKLS